MKPYTPVPMDVFWLVVRPYCTVWCMLLRSKDRVPSVHPSRTALFFNFLDPAPAAPIKKGTHHFILLPSLHHFFIISSSFSFSLHHCHPTNRTIIRQKGMFWKIGWLLFYKRENMVDITMFSKLIFATESLRMLPIGIYVFCFSVCSIFIFFPTESLRMIPIGIYVFFCLFYFYFFPYGITAHGSHWNLCFLFFCLFDFYLFFIWYFLNSTNSNSTYYRLSFNRNFLPSTIYHVLFVLPRTTWCEKIWSCISFLLFLLIHTGVFPFLYESHSYQ